MIRPSAFVIGILCSVCAYAQSGRQVRTYGILSVTETVEEYKDGMVAHTFVSAKEVFDKRGEWVERITYNKDGSLDERITRKYKGRVIVAETEEEGPQKGKKGHDGEFQRETYVYHKGDLVEKSRWNREGEMEWKEVYTYDKYGEKIREERLSGAGKLKEVEEFLYDKRGLKVTKTTTDAEGQLIEKSTFAYEIR